MTLVFVGNKQTNKKNNARPEGGVCSTHTHPGCTSHRASPPGSPDTAKPTPLLCTECPWALKPGSLTDFTGDPFPRTQHFFMGLLLIGSHQPQVLQNGLNIASRPPGQHRCVQKHRGWGWELGGTPSSMAGPVLPIGPSHLFSYPWEHGLPLIGEGPHSHGCNCEKGGCVSDELGVRLSFSFRQGIRGEFMTLPSGIKEFLWLAVESTFSVA